jgi:hypothetical protein
MCKAVYQPAANGIAYAGHHNRHRRGRGSDRQHLRRPARHDNVRAADEFRRERRQPLIVSVGDGPFEGYVVALHPTQITQPVDELLPSK